MAGSISADDVHKFAEALKNVKQTQKCRTCYRAISPSEVSQKRRKRKRRANSFASGAQDASKLSESGGQAWNSDDGMTDSVMSSEDGKQLLQAIKTGRRREDQEYEQLAGGALPPRAAQGGGRSFD